MSSTIWGSPGDGNMPSDVFNTLEGGDPNIEGEDGGGFQAGHDGTNLDPNQGDPNNQPVDEIKIKRSDWEATQAKINELTGAMSAYQSLGAANKRYEEPAPPAAPNIEQIRAELAPIAQQIKDAEQQGDYVTAEMLRGRITAAITQAQIANASGPILASNARQAVEFHISQLAARDPYFKSYEKRFREMVDTSNPKELANLFANGTLGKALDSAADAAFGAVQREAAIRNAGKGGSNRPTPPNYGAGTAGGGGGTPPGSAAKTFGKSKVDAVALSIGKDLGFTDEDMKLMADLDAEDRESEE